MLVASNNSQDFAAMVGAGKVCAVAVAYLNKEAMVSRVFERKFFILKSKDPEVKVMRKIIFRKNK